MDRLYKKQVEEYLTNYGKLVFISGARQVGKTTISKQVIKPNPNSIYLNWDYLEDRNKILNKHTELFKNLLSTISDKKPCLILDEIHKYKDWKSLVKGFYDKFGENIEFIITGSAKLNIYKKGGDSLMGRYISLTVHPLSVSEIAKNFDNDIDYIKSPQNITIDEFKALINFGGFAESYLKATAKFHRIWSNQRFKQLFREDVRNTEDINNIYALSLLTSIINEQAGSLISYTNLANKVRVSDQTIRRWLSLLEKHYYCFAIKPWSKNVVKSLIKEPQIYLWDWSQIKDIGTRFENLVASHLLKAVYFWNETGLGDFGLYYLRDKQKREVDLVITKDNQPWILVEAKVSDSTVSSSLKYFHELLNPEFSFQVIQNKQAISGSCFDKPDLWIVPAITFLSQLV
ncbi:ATP-binding protein [Rickettsia fournieri]|uniref:ATP-binding protein n=1 Tax=Rickettsia fournieri TaxID=1436798 RepID=UPI000CDF00BB|nr:ATP-binding protein [Rickettsia fournieri]